MNYKRKRGLRPVRNFSALNRAIEGLLDAIQERFCSSIGLPLPPIDDVKCDASPFDNELLQPSLDRISWFPTSELDIEFIRKLDYRMTTTPDLKMKLEKAIESEDYERAVLIRGELSKRGK